MLALKTWWPALVPIVIGLLFFAHGKWEAHKAVKVDRLTTVNQQLKTENKEIRHEAQALLDRPRTRSDRINRLCDGAVRVAREVEGKPIKRLPAFCSSCPLRGEDLPRR